MMLVCVTIRNIVSGVIEMIRYPNGKKVIVQKKDTITGDYANRGLSFEHDINVSNEFYRSQNIAVIYKKDTPIKVVKMVQSKQGHCIQEAYFQAPSTTDYNGLYRGCYIDFEAKETKNKTLFPLANIHLHQIDHMRAIVQHRGIGFLLVYFKQLGKVYLLDYRHVIERANEKKASIPFSVFETQGHEVPQSYMAPVAYLKIVDFIYFKEKKEAIF